MSTTITAFLKLDKNESADRFRAKQRDTTFYTYGNGCRLQFAADMPDGGVQPGCVYQLFDSPENPEICKITFEPSAQSLLWPGRRFDLIQNETKIGQGVIHNIGHAQSCYWGVSLIANPDADGEDGYLYLNTNLLVDIGNGEPVEAQLYDANNCPETIGIVDDSPSNHGLRFKHLDRIGVGHPVRVLDQDGNLLATGQTTTYFDDGDVWVKALFIYEGSPPDDYGVIQGWYKGFKDGHHIVNADSDGDSDWGSPPWVDYECVAACEPQSFPNELLTQYAQWLRLEYTNRAVAELKEHLLNESK